MRTLNPTRQMTAEQREELSQLLTAAVITSAASVELRGNSVYCVIDVSPSDTTANRFDVMLLVFDQDGELLILDDVAFTAAGETPQGQLLLHLERRTKRGIKVIENLHCEAAYHLLLCRVPIVVSDEPLALRGARYGLNAADYALHGDSNAPEADGPRRFGPFRSADGRLIAGIVELEAGNVLIEISTRDPALANVTARFHFVDEQDQVQHSGEVELIEQAGDPGLWSGVWQGPLALSAPCRLLFEA